jgi:hypothetical protein
VGTEGIRVVPDVVNGDNRAPTGIVSITADRSRGWWTDGTSWGTWRRDGDAARVYESDGAESCSGPLYDFGVGATGWCDLGGPDLEFIAWTYAATDGAGERLDVDDPVVSDGRGVPPG